MKGFSFRSMAMFFVGGLITVMFIVASCSSGDDAAQVTADEFVSIIGTITDFNNMGESGVAMEGVYSNPGDSLNPVTATDTNGNFSLQVLKNNAVYLHATKTSLTTINTARAPLNANVTGVKYGMPTEEEAQSLIDAALDAATTGLESHAWLIVDVEDANGNEISGHTVSPVPSPVVEVYTDCDGADSGGAETTGPCVPGRPGTMYIAYFDSPAEASVTVGSETQSAPIRMGEVTALEFEVAAIPVNNPPVAVNDALTAVQGATTNLNLAVNDSDADDGLDLASITIVTAPVHANQPVVVKSDGIVDYTHDGTATTTDTFTYTIKDKSGVVSNIATVTLTITAVPVNNPPVAVDDALSAVQGTTSNLNLAVNDSDADDGLDPASIAIVPGTEPAHGIIVNKFDGTVDYTHDGTTATSDTFAYTIKDISGAVSNTATVTLTITAVPVNNPPIAVNDALSADHGTTTNLDLAVNDSDADDGLDLASIIIVSAPAHANGPVVVKSDGTVDYTHDGTATASDIFTYTIRDISGAVSNTATVTITIVAVPVNIPPIAVDDDLPANQGGTTILDLAFNDTDADDGLDLASITIGMGPAHASISNNFDGTVDYNHDGSVTLSDTFTYTIKDNSDAVSNTATVTITIFGGFTAGQAKYDDACASCHAAGSYDTSSTKQAGDLYSDGEKLVTDLSSLGGMNNLSITQQELLDLRAFLDDPSIAP